MFEEDDRGDLLVLPTHRVDDHDEPEPAFEPGSQIEAEPQPEVEIEPEIVRVKTLREMFYSQEPWSSIDRKETTPGIRRLMEMRVNRALTTVADWMLGLVEQHVGDEMALVVLLEQAEAVRKQIIWPEREASEALAALAREAQEQER